MTSRKGAIPKATKSLPFQRSTKTLRSPTTKQSSQGKNETANTTSGTADESIYPCDVCSITDNGDKVCCDNCNLWSHFACVNVTSDIANHEWFCGKCKSQRQEPLVETNTNVAINTETTKANTTNVSMQEESLNVISVETPTVDVASHLAQQVISEQRQIFVVPPTNDNIRPNASRSRKSASIRSTTSSTSRKKALALQRLEEEQQLQRMRDQEERERREEERKQRELKDKEYLDKKYSIMEINSDDSLSYDRYDDSLNPTGYEKVQRWRESLPSRVQRENPYVDPDGPDGWDDGATGRTKIIPQMSSTNIFHPQLNKVVNPTDEQVPNLEDIGFDSTIEPTVSNQSDIQLVNPTYTIDVQSTQHNTATIPRGTQIVQSNVRTIDTTTEPLQIELTKAFYSTFRQPSNDQSVNQIVTSSSQQLTRPVVSNGYTQLVASNKQQLGVPSYNHQLGVPSTNQQLGNSSSWQHSNVRPNGHVQPVMLNNRQFRQQLYVPSNDQPSNAVLTTTTNRTFNHTTNVATDIVNSAIQPTDPPNNTTFVISNPPLTNSNDLNRNQPLNSWNQHPISSQMPVVLNQQPIMSSYHQSILGHTPIVSNHSSTMNYQQHTSNTQQITSMQQSSMVNNRQYAPNLQSTSINQPISSVGLLYQGSNLNAQFGTSTSSSVPYNYGQQPNLNWSSNPSMNTSHVPSAPFNQVNNTIGIRQLTKEQIAARQVVPKALPKFYGGSENWNKFISAYNNSTVLCGFNDYENLERIRESLQGDAHDAVESLLVNANAVPDVITTLAMMWGRPEQVIESKIQEIQKEPAPKDDDLASLMKFAIKVRNLSGTIQNTGAMEHLKNPTLINTITDKLPTQVQLQWAFHKLNVGAVDLAVLGNWLYQIAQAASLVVRTNCTSSSKKKEQREKKDQPKGNNSSNQSSTKISNYVNTQVESSTKTDQKSAFDTKKCPACKNSSCTKIGSCKKFKEMNRMERSNIVKENRLCSRCLGGHHFYRCRSNTACKVDGCNVKHHTLLHNHEKSSESPSKNEKSSKFNDDRSEIKNSVDKFSSNASHANATLPKQSQRIDMFRIVPIMVSHKEKTIKLFAYLDDGSNMTTMETSLANELKINGTSAPICVDWAFGQRHTVDSKIVSVKVSGCFDKAKKFELNNIRTVKKLYLPTQSISQAWLDQFEHLHGIPISTYDSVKPRMLIGLQYSRLMVSLKTVEGKENEPIACKTRLGWVIQGPSFDNGEDPDRKYSMNLCDCKSDDNNLHQLVKEYFSTENLGVKIPDAILESKDIQRAKQIMESTTSKKDRRYETGLLWKYDRIELPNSYNMALKRLQCLELKMSKDPKLADNLCNQIRQFIDKGYIRKLTPKELRASNDSPVWYLPTFPAFNPKKPEKVRIVWDGAAKVMNISLNSLLLIGPDQLIPLPDILRRFRERLYAMIGDIKEMYHQIKVIKVDQNVQRFLWRDGDSSREPDVFVMMVVTFGLTCSPSQAQFIKNKNALEFIEEFPEAVNTIINNHYVDDMLDCEHTLEAAEKRINQVKFIHKEGGFEIRNFMSNSKELLRRIGETPDQLSKNMNISLDLGTERVLGMFWNMSSDCFTFSLKFTKVNQRILSGKQFPTKREVLRVLMSVFDPLGLLANYLIYTKILLQEIWRTKVDWDEQINHANFKKWVAWIKTLPNVENIQIPRLYSPKLSPVPPKNIQMHIFVDASAEAYATAIYFRIEDEKGVDCCLAGAKTKVAPNKPMTIPRLELQGGVIGTRLANSIKSSQTFKIDKKVFWTDSRTVMGWINSETRRYNQFVAFRIGEILESSNQSEWRWIPSEQNVADEATKSKNIAKLESSSRWFKAPKFLYDNENSWFNVDIEYITEEELRPSFTMASREILRPQLIDLERFSHWNRLLRAQAYVFRFIHNIRQRQQDRRYGPLSQQEIQVAENHLYRRAQLDCFLDEIVIMRHNQIASEENSKYFEKSSVLQTYSPYLDEYDVIRMKGRIDEATALSYETKRPIILPRRHSITKLVVDYYHRRYKHINHSTALNEIRQKYVIPALRVVMKTIRNSCQKCKNRLVEPKIPEMAELPAARLATHTLPFTYVGVDYFGPLKVRNGRKTRKRPVVTEKRWILLFTCLTTRAIWMEITHSLDTNSCIMAIDNFILRKGQPREIFSDNGGSFHGSDKELSDEFEKMNQKEIEEKFTNSEMVWKFNPPATPHMGGIWERLISTVKSCLKQTMQTRCPNDEMLKNLIVEAEYIVNSRPLTYVSLESADEEALTPNHILLGSSNGIKPMINVTEKDLARNTYKAVQVLANNFWRRFVLEYMPTLTKRTKWFKQVEPIKVGDVVVVVDEKNERNTWPKGIVKELLPGKRGIVRQVMVRTAKGIRRRSVGKLAILDVKPPMKEVNQNPMVPVNGEGNVGQQAKLSTLIYKN